MYCSMLQSVTMCYSMWQCVTVRCSVSTPRTLGLYVEGPDSVGCYSVLQYVAVGYNVLQRVTMCYSMLQCVNRVVDSTIRVPEKGGPTLCNTFQHRDTATHCNTLQHTTIHCNAQHLFLLKGWSDTLRCAPRAKKAWVCTRTCVCTCVCVCECWCVTNRESRSDTSRRYTVTKQHSNTATR